MGELWRSKKMTLLQLFVQFEAAHDTVEGLGKLGLLMFVDLNQHLLPHQKHFVTELKRLSPLQMVISSFIEQIEIANTTYDLQEVPLIQLSPVIEGKELRMDEVEESMTELKTQMDQSLERQNQLDKNHYQIIELKDILGADDGGFFSEVVEDPVVDSSDEGDEGEFKLESLGPIQGKGKTKDIELLVENDSKLRFLTGVVPREKFSVLERTLFRISKGQAFLKYRELEKPIFDPEKGKFVDKNSFIVFYRGKYLGDKITKLCIAYESHVYPCPDSSKDRKSLRKQLTARLQELELVRVKGQNHVRQILEEVARSVQTWHQFLLKEVAIFHTLNYFNFDQGRQTLIGECWCPTEIIPEVHHTLAEARKKSGSTLDSILSVMETGQQPPTYFKTNKFTKVFQKIVDAYGIARYREVNPAVFTVITFPWQFGIMFGDVGHGFLLLLFALLMMYKEKDWEGRSDLNEMLAWPFKGRYLLLLMAFYSIWMGALYNECFAVTMDFGSNWHLQTGPQFDNNTFWPNSLSPDDTYAFGVDPVWKGSTSELLYYNSVKMKMSIIVGVIQMTVGLFLHLLNAWEFNKPWDILFEFIPRFIFLESIFGYLCFMIFFKWGHNYIGQDIYNQENGINGTVAVGPLAGTSEAPILLNELIYMFLPSSSGIDNLYHGQNTAQSVLRILAFVSIPFMFIPKPFLLRWEYYRKIKKTQVTTTVVIEKDSPESSGQSLEDSENEEKEAQVIPKTTSPNDMIFSEAGAPDEEPFEFGEIMIHQLLETIEFVLGSISHTASYLRLWALSLAHSELATVFWDKIMFELVSLTMSLHWIVVAFALFAAFSVWFTVTLLVMMFMELLSALLHALRLHWVEFQSKFYKGDGYAFVPFSFRTVYKHNRLKLEKPRRREE